jgi:hypothetical protein
MAVATGLTNVPPVQLQSPGGMVEAMWQQGAMVPVQEGVALLSASPPNVPAAIEAFDRAFAGMEAVRSSSQDQNIKDELWGIMEKFGVPQGSLIPHAGSLAEIASIKDLLEGKINYIEGDKDAIVAQEAEATRSMAAAMWTNTATTPAQQALDELGKDKPDIAKAITLLQRSRSGMQAVLYTVMGQGLAGPAPIIFNLTMGINQVIALLEPHVGVIMSLEQIEQEFNRISGHMNMFGAGLQRAANEAKAAEVSAGAAGTAAP